MIAQRVGLPVGLRDADGLYHKEFEVRPLCGRDEELLAGSSSSCSAALVSSLLARCVKRIGAVSPVSERHTRSLLVADRQYLLLQVRAACFGSQVQADLPCFWPDCGQKFSISFSTDDIPVEIPEPVQVFYIMNLTQEATFTGPDGRVCDTLRFRLPDGGDQEAIADLARVNEPLAATHLMERCLLDTDGTAPEDLVACFTPRTRAALESEMVRVAPRLQTTIEATCPECGREVGVPLDIHELFLGDLSISVELLRREVHYLAFHYHWSEREIMAMNREKRHEYIRVLAEEMEKTHDEI